MRMQRELEAEGRTKRSELSALESRLLQRDEQLDQRTDMLEERDRKLLGRERELDQAKEDLAKARQEQIAALEKVSGLSQQDAKALLLEEVRLGLREMPHRAVGLTPPAQKVAAQGTGNARR